MAEVKRRNGISAMPLKNPPSFNHTSSSYKHIYDDVFASPLQSRQQQSSAFIEDDYAEMFGASRSNNGTWSISYSSIPVLDLPPPTEMRVRGASGVTTVSGDRGGGGGGNLDYSGVFGGFGDGNFGLPDGEELFDQFSKKANTSSNAKERGKVQTMEGNKPDMLRQSQTHSIGSIPELTRDKKEDVVKKSGEIKKAARARDLPGSTNKVEEAVPAQAPLPVKMPVIEDDDTQLDKDVNLALNQGKHDRHISMDLGFDVKNDNSIFLEEPGFNASNSMDKAHDSSQSATGSTNSLSQPPGGSSNSLSEPSNDSKDSDHMKNKMHNTGTSEPLCTAEVHAIHESTSALHETEVTEPTYLSSETSVMEDNIETQTNVNMLEKQGKHSRSTSSEVKGSLHNGEPLSLDTSQDTPQATVEAELSKTDNDDATSSFDLRRKKGRHSRITSLDLGDRKHLPEQDGRPQRKPRFSGSYSFDASNDSHASRIKVQPSMMAPSSSVPQFFPVESRYKISENSTWRNFGSNVYRDVSVSPPSLDEQLDMNSPAAISAVALQRAIEEASMIIQMAKEYLEREGQGSSNVRFKDTLKVGVTNDDQFADEMDEFRHYMTYEYCPPKDTEKQKLPFVEDTLKVKVTEDNQLSDEMNNSQQTMIPEISQPTYIEKEKLSVSERPSDLEIGQPSQVFEDVKKVSSDVSMVHDQNNTDEGHMNEAIIHNNGLPAGSVKESISLSERTSELENGLPSQISEDPKTFVKDDNMFQDGKKFVQDEIYLEERKPDVSKYTAERDRQGGPGGEWEAAKHLNQLISGVKNKFASFMAWQTDTERKDLKETEACKRSQEYEGGPDLVDEEHNEMKTNLINQDHAGCPGEHVEMEIGFLSETIDPCEDESFWSNTAEQETVENSVHLNPAAPLSPLESLVFYPFRKEEIHDPMDTTEEREGPNECTEIEFMNGQEVPSEMKFEQLQDTCEEQNREALVDTYIKENREVLDDASTNQIPEAFDDSCTKKHEVFDDTNIEEITEIVEEPCLQAGKEIHDSTEEDPMRSLVEECREDNTHDSLYSESTTETVDEHGNSDDSNIEETNEIVEEPYLQAGKEINDSTEEDPMRTLDEECREDHTLDSHYSESTMETVEEHGNSEECEKTKESENWQHDAQILEEIYLEGEIQATEETNDCQEIERGLSQTDEAAGQNHGCSNESMTYDTLNDHVEKVEVAEKEIFTGEDAFMKSEPCSIEVITEEMAKEASVVTEVEDEQTKIENDYIEDTAEQVTCFGIIEDDLGQTEHTCLSEAEEPFTNDQSSGGVEEMESSDDKHARTMEILKPSSETETKKEETTIFYDSFVELDEITEDLDDDDDQTFEVENSGLHGSQSDVHPREEEISANIMETESRDILENQTEHVHDSEESPDVGVIDTSSGEEVEKCGVDAVQKRRRWFDNGVKVGLAGRPSILEGDVTEVETDQEALDEFILAGSVEIHSDELDSGKQEVKQESGSVNTAESTPKRRRWSVKIGEEGLPVPPPLFQGVNVEEPQNVPHSKSEGSIYDLNAKSGETLNAPDVCVFLNGEKDKSSIDAAPKRKRWFTSGENIGPIPHPRSSGDATDHDSHVIGDIENQKCDDMSSTEDTEAEPCKMEAVNDRNVDEVNRKEKERMVVERAIREARERAFADARERARRDASEKPNVEVRQKVGAGAQEKAGKVPAESRGSSDKASIDAKLRAERAAVERATSEARERALQKALSEKSSHRSREQKNTSSDPSFQSSSSFSRADMSNKGEKHDAFDSESAQRRKARSERQSRTMEQPATALEEKNRRELLVQKEQAAKLQMMENSLDAEVKRWSAGKEGNLRLLLSTLQYILGPESGWQTVSLTDLMAATAVRKAYKKATLCVHPDKLQQRGATFQQKYVCERVFDLLKDAWSKLNPNER